MGDKMTGTAQAASRWDIHSCCCLLLVNTEPGVGKMLTIRTQNRRLTTWWRSGRVRQGTWQLQHRPRVMRTEWEWRQWQRVRWASSSHWG
jgi:hypothetical protein